MSMKIFIIEQKITALANQYRVFDTHSNGSKNALISFAHQKRFAFKEEVQFFKDESKSTLVFKVRAEKIMDIHGKFIINDPQDKPLGAVRKVFKTSLLRSTWEVIDTNDSLQALVQERSMGIAIFRRLWGFIPYLGDVPFFIKYHFDFVDPKTQQVLATYYKTTRFRDHYVLEVTDETLIEKVGWQTMVAQAVLLDALQGR